MEIDMQDGFYREYDGYLQHAPNFVFGPDYHLTRPNRNGYTYPKEGWIWADSVDEAEAALGVSLPPVDGANA